MERSVKTVKIPKRYVHADKEWSLKALIYLVLTLILIADIKRIVSKWTILNFHYCVRQEIWVEGQNIKYIELQEDPFCENIKFLWKQISEVITAAKKPCSTNKTKSKYFFTPVLNVFTPNQLENHLKLLHNNPSLTIFLQPWQWARTTDGNFDFENKAQF